MKKVTISKFPLLDYSANESMNTLCTNLSFMGSNVKKIMFTSCHPNEGKSSISMNVMRTFASMGMAVVLVDADLRKSVLASKYGVTYPKNHLGLTHYLAKELVLEDVLYETDLPGAYIIPAGHEVLNSMQLLSTWRFPKLLDQLCTMFDYVIIDTPPVGAIIDPAVIARSCDGTVFVVSENMTRKKELIEAKKQIESANCAILGAVLNNVSMKSRSNKYYYRTKYTAY